MSKKSIKKDRRKPKLISQISHKELLLRIYEFEDIKFKCNSCKKNGFFTVEGKGDKAYLSCETKNCKQRYYINEPMRYFLEKRLRYHLRKEFLTKKKLE